ncbi:metallophosphoesterase [Pseudoprevotella muciniphila]|uniref:Phosphoesterase n=1 Tax=Pseudoprevotella muciniphila TaxID=2133944 RepID=A0A5P8E6P0_9BACT|nr:metallophosphoesterase family protein [Pseudoprevotella muciniphila]QFQ12537.1 metallophosphoesterase [Pseudoprevotella muciniphila]
MTRIGLLSDTHGFWDSRYEQYFAECDEIWHAGDIGTTEIADRLNAIKPLTAVYGNIDGEDLRRCYPELIRFKCEEVEILMKHIGGYPGNYDRSIRQNIFNNPPKLFISGHSHILKVVYDKNLQLLHINPGAAGIQGWQKARTLVRFTIDRTEIKDVEVIELGVDS